MTHSYVWQGSKLAADITDAYTLYFHYDSTGDVIGFTRTANGADTEYFYVKNLQGDILKVITADGTEAATYTYDAWGKLLTSSGDMADVNPLRYRGYFYDAETSLYYLKSRYYDPEVGRFISSDEVTSTGQGILGTNMFAYCLNNPACVGDTEGKFGNWLIGGVVGAAVGAVSALIKGENVLAAAAQGAVSGAIVGVGVDIAIVTVATGGIAAIGIAFLSGALGSVAGEVTSAIISGKNFNMDAGVIKRAIISGGVNLLSFGIGTLMKYVQTNSLPQSNGFKEAMQNAFQGTTKATVVKGVKEIGYDVMSVFQATHLSAIGGLSYEMVS